MLKLKENLLATGFFLDNNYLDEYVELILNNLNTVKSIGVTQEHHIIPIFCYSIENSQPRKYSSESNKRRRELLKVANADPINKRIQLSYADHVKAHMLMTKCGKSYSFTLSNANACILMLNLVHVALDHNIVTDLESDSNIQKAYVYFNSIKTKPKDNLKYYQASVKNLKQGGADRKVRCLETGIIYSTIKEAEDANGLTRYRLNQILTGRRKQIPGMTFEYYNETSGISEVSLWLGLSKHQPQ